MEFRDQCRARGHDAEELLEKWAVDHEFRQLSQTHSTNWDTADRLALTLLATQ